MMNRAIRSSSKRQQHALQFGRLYKKKTHLECKTLSLNQHPFILNTVELTLLSLFVYKKKTLTVSRNK